MDGYNLYQEIAKRTDGNIYIGVVGPVRTGKSTFIKRFMETLVIPHIENVYAKERARDELPQSGSGRTIMTAEPKFVPEDAVDISLDGMAACSVRMIDSVGYMVDGAIGEFEGGTERLVTTPWFDHEVTMREAAETGTRKVITEHSTIGIVVTTDGSVSELPRESYVEPERRAIRQLQEIGKPFLVLLNCQDPESESAQQLRAQIEADYAVTCLAVNCMLLDETQITEIIKSVLYEFPVGELGLYLPSWVDALPADHPVKSTLLTGIREKAAGMVRVRDVSACVSLMGEIEGVQTVTVTQVDLGTGSVTATAELPRALFYTTLSSASGFSVADDGDLMQLLTALAVMKSKYDRISAALDDVQESGYGIVMPDRDELTLQEPEVVRQGGRYSVRLKASAPSIHMIRANVETEVSPALGGGERTGGDIINFLLQEFEGDASKIWESNMFGKSLYDIASEGLQAKIKHMPESARKKLQETLQRIINEGSSGLICILL